MYDFELKKNDTEDRKEDQAEAVERGLAEAAKKKLKASLVKEDEKNWYFKTYK